MPGSQVNMLGMDYDQTVSDLAVPHRSKRALRDLMWAGTPATPAVRRGLLHPDARVRAACCNVLDHYLDETAIPELILALDDCEPTVRARALHALACDRCKQGVCRPSEGVLPTAIRMLTEDPDREVRESAVQMLGPAVHRSPEALAAIVRARVEDPAPQVRKVAAWYCPGGPIYEGRPSRLGRRREKP